MPLAFALECRSHLELEAKSWADKLKAESWDKLRSLDAHFWCETGNNFKGTKSHAQRNTTSYCNSCSYCMVRSEECLYAVKSCGLTLAQLSLSFLSTKKCNVLLPHLKKCKKKNETVKNIRIEWITMITIPRAPLVSPATPTMEMQCFAWNKPWPDQLGSTAFRAFGCKQKMTSLIVRLLSRNSLLSIYHITFGKREYRSNDKIYHYIRWHK